MKKILTILAAVAGLAAFGTVPEFKQSGTSFESYGDRPFDPLKDDAGSGSESGRYWFTTDTDAANVLSNYVGDVVNSEPKLTPTGVSRPDYFAPSNNTKYLSVETTGKLFRTIEPNDGNAEFSPHEIPVDGIYLDTLVKFTAADSVFGDDALADGDKIAIEYVEHEPEDENDVAITNFVIRAGYVDGNNTQTNYYAAVPEGFNKDEWHRLTVRSIKNVGDNSVGFIIYLDGDMSKMLTYSTSVAAGNATYTTALAQNSLVSTYFYNDNVHALFPSVVRSGDDASSISAVAFSGNGSLDDVVFTTDKPGFINETTSVTVTWDPAKVISVMLNGDDVTVANGSTTFQPTNSAISVAVEFVQGYVMGACYTSGEGEWNGTDAFINLSAGEVCNIVAMQPLYEVNGVPFDNLELAMVAAAAGTEQAPATLKLLADCNTALGFAEGYIILDLNGCDIQGNGSDFSIGNIGATLIITNSGAEASVLIPADRGDGEPGTGPLYAAAGYTMIQAGIFEGIILTTADDDTVFVQDLVGITGGKFYYPGYDDTDPTTFYLYACVAQGLDLTQDGDYVQVGGGSVPPAPVIPTYTLTIPSVTGASAAVTSNSVVVADLTAIPSNTEVVVTWTATEGYKITAGASETITMDSNKTATAPTVELISYVTLTITQVANCTIVVSNATEEVATGSKFDIDDAVKLTVYRTPADGYELDGYSAVEVITMDENQAVTAAVKQSGGSNWPSSWNGGTEPASMAEAFNTWVANNDPTAANAEAAFLVGVNVAAYTSDFAAASITLADGKVVITGNYDLTKINGVLSVKMGNEPNALNTTTVINELTNGAISLTPALGETKKFYKLMIGYPAN